MAIRTDSSTCLNAGAQAVTDRRLDPARLFVEGLVIVVSILLAFALDAWWDGRQEAEIEKEMLTALESELAGALRILDLQIDVHEIHAENVLTVADALAAAGDGATIEVDDQAIMSLTHNPTYDPPFGIASALLASGQTSVLTNADLRAALGRWPAAVADGYEDQAMLVESSTSYLAPLLQQSIADMRSPYMAQMSNESSRTFPREPLGTASGVTASPALWNALYERHARSRVAISDLGRTRVQLIELIGLVEGELD